MSFSLRRLRVGDGRHHRPRSNPSRGPLPMTKPLFSALILSALAAGCAARQRFMDDCPGAAQVDLASRVPVAVDLKTVAGGSDFALGVAQRSHSGVQYKVS